MRLDNDWHEIRDGDEYLHIGAIAERFGKTTNRVRELIEAWQNRTGKKADHRGDRWNLRHVRNIVMFSRSNTYNGQIGRRTH
jgi:hypothetical protein